ncbi:MAG: AzlC family ABC transporter permease [Treponema sp.]|nr:AzlC family ABC transporter permease [Treponema sp.]
MTWRRKINRRRLFGQAARYTAPVLLGYMAIGIAFGLLLVEAGYAWRLSLAMSIVMYAGAGQYIAVGLFSAGAGLTEAALVQLVVNARHAAYGFSMLQRFEKTGPFKWYLIFALTDETFALLSSLPEVESMKDGLGKHTESERAWFMFFVALLDQFYWVAGSVIGAVAGSLLPFDFGGVGFALTSLFIVLMLEQMLKTRKPTIFIVSAFTAVGTVAFFPARASLLLGMAISLTAIYFIEKNVEKRKVR